jgi:HEAT repeat protein
VSSRAHRVSGATIGDEVADAIDQLRSPHRIEKLESVAAFLADHLELPKLHRLVMNAAEPEPLKRHLTVVLGEMAARHAELRPKAADLLIKMTNTSFPQSVRVSAVDVLGNVENGDPAVVNELRKLKRDADKSIRSSAADALESLTA